MEWKMVEHEMGVNTITFGVLLPEINEIITGSKCKVYTIFLILQVSPLNGKVLLIVTA